MTTGGSSIYWDDGTCRQRIINTDDSTANTAVFNFQQSENSGSSWKNLLEIRDNGRLVLTNKTGGIYRVDDGATNEPLIHLSNNNVDSSIMRIDGNGRTSVVNTQSYGFDLKYIGTGGGESNSLDLIADNMDGANVTAISVSNNGKIGIGDKFNTNYRLYVNGNSYLKGNNFLYGDLSAFYDEIDQYLQYTAEGTVASHAAKISLYRIIASGKAGTAGIKVPGVQLDAATGMLHLQAAASDPSATAGARIKFTYWSAADSNGQPVYISHSINDSYRAPYGLKIWGSDGSTPGAWLEVEGNLYIGSASNSNSNNNAALYIRGMSAIEGYDTWLRLNDNSSFSSGTLSPKLIRSDEALQVGSGGANFYANSSGNGYIQNTFGVHGTDTTKHFFVNGTSRFADDITMDNGSEILFSTNTQYLRWTTNTGDNNSTGRSWYGIGTYQNTSDSNNSWLNISNYWGINITTKGNTCLRHNNNVITTTGNQTGTVGSGTHPIYSSGGVLMASSSTVGSGVKGIYLNAGAITPMSYELKSTVNSGTANRIAYYSGTTAISSGNNIWTNGTKLQINEISAEKNYNFYVNGTSYFNGNIQIVGTTTARNINPETDNTYSLGTNSYRWKDLSLARSIKSNSRYYPIVGNAYGSAWYKVTFPWAGQTRDSNASFMTSMDLVIGGPYNNGTSGTVYLGYYFSYTGSSHTYSAANVYGSAIGTRLDNIIIKYDLTNPGIMYVKASSNQYCGLAIKNLMVHDSAPSYDFTTTTIQTIAEADIPVGANKTVPLTLFGSNDGASSNAGSAKQPIYFSNGTPVTGDTHYVFWEEESTSNPSNVANIINLVYPVGSIYMSTSSTSPSTLFPGTTWVAWGQGRVPVGVASSGTFSGSETTGGSETVTAGGSIANTTAGGTVANTTLTTAQIPSHYHDELHWGCPTASQFGVNHGSSNIKNPTWYFSYAGVSSTAQANFYSGNTGGGGAHNHGFTGTAHNHGFTGSAHSNLQPYITCYMWKRTA